MLDRQAEEVEGQIVADHGPSLPERRAKEDLLDELLAGPASFSTNLVYALSPHFEWLDRPYVSDKPAIDGVSSRASQV